MKFRKNRSHDQASPLAPLLDVVLLLLIFFVVSTSFVDEQMPLDLPGADSGQAGSAEALIVNVDATGAVVLDGTLLTEGELERTLEAAARADSSLELRADRTTHHGAVVRVLDLARQAGLDRVGIGVKEGRAIER